MTDKRQPTAPEQNANTDTVESGNAPKTSKTAGRKPLSHYDVIANRKLQKKVLKKGEIAEAKKAALVNNIRLHPHYQSKPRTFSTYTEHKNRSFTDSLESYQNGADKERQILQWNMQHYGREPKKEIVLHLFQEFSAVALNVLRKWIFYHLKNAGINAITNIELTRSRPKIGKPNNRVHFHILTDDPRSENELRAIFKAACERWGLTKKDYRIDYAEINNAYWYFEYFTKYDRKGKAEIEAKRKMMKDKEWDWDGNKDVDTKEVIGRDWSWKTVVLFGQYKGLQKFKPIGQWFQKGKGKGKIWEEIQAYMRKKNAK